MRPLPIRYTKEAKVYQVTRTTGSNGFKTETYTLANSYNVQIQEIKGELKKSLYGANIDEILRLYSVNDTISAFLKARFNNSSDNVSDYCIVINNYKYTILNVFDTYIDVSYSGKYETNSL